MNRYLWILLPLILAYSCKQKGEKELFELVPAERSGLDFVNTVKDTEELSILDYLYFYNGGGVAVGDINGDGLPDIYFTSNLGKNKLYLNKGDLKFEDITEKAGVEGNSDWNTGVVMADVNGDGLLDIYVCAVVGLKGFDGHNELFINNGDNTFTESARQYGLDFESYSSSAAFFDFDNDGDLDMYLLNHAVHSVNSFGPASIRETRVYESGDKLLRNDKGVFVDVSEQAGIFGGYNSYGLGLVTADFNNDGYTDIYICNDFHEDDYFYINNGDGTFTESVKIYFGHTSRFSMGSDAADINHDGYMDLLSLDMLPEDEEVLKASDGDESVDILQLRINQLGYHYQFTRNMLQINQQGNHFLETALYSGVAATDWSWSALFADYNQDGEQDLFVFNGIPKRPNNLDYVKYISNEQIQKKISQTKLVDNEALDLMPTGIVPNYIFEGKPGIGFQDRSGEWISKDPMISNGSAYADFDNDGDLDVVANNLNSTPALYENKTNEKAAYLKVKLEFEKANRFAIGAKVISYHQGLTQHRQLFTSKGFQSSSEALVHFGYNTAKTIDSLLVIWPDNTFQSLHSVPVNQTITIKASPQRQKVNYDLLFPKRTPLFQQVNIDSLGISYVHKENNFNDFNRQKLIPYRISDKGPGVTVDDVDGDGNMDIVFGSSIHKKTRIFLQKNGLFKEQEAPVIANDSLSEDIQLLLEDFNKDGFKDLFVMSSGGEYYRENKNLLDRLYLGSDKGFLTKSQGVPEYFENSAVLKTCDFDRDGDMDIFVGGGYVSYDFGKIPNSYILRNEGGKFTKLGIEGLQNAGMLTDAIWTDFDGDNKTDLIVIGEWMAPQFFKNENNTFVKVNKTGDQKLNGLWQQMVLFDIDDDGDEDIVLGNWGLNSKLSATREFPLKMYYGDVDGNKIFETIVAIAKKGRYYPLLGLDDLASQFSPMLKKKFTNYGSFAKQDLEGIFDPESLTKTALFEVHELSSGYLENKNGNYIFHAFPEQLQLAPVTRFLTFDFDKDGKEELLAAGNFFGVTPFHGRLDANPGYLIKNNTTITPASQLGMNLSNKLVRGLQVINIQQKEFILVTLNNNKPELYLIKK